MFPDCGPLAHRWVRYRHTCPVDETGAILPVKTGVPAEKVATDAFFAAGIGAVRASKALHIDKRELMCACFGGNSNSSPRFMSLAESPMTVSLTTWMLTKASGPLA